MPNGPFTTLAVLAALSSLPVSALAKRVPQHPALSHWVAPKHRVEVVPVKSRHAKPEPKPHEKLARTKETKGHGRHERASAKVEKPPVKLSAKAERRRRRNEEKPEPKLVAVVERRKAPEAPKPEAAVSEPASTPVSVVSVVRQSTEHPALEPVADVVATPQIMPQLYGSGGRLNVLPAMRGTHEILVRQNVMADLDGLSRIQDDDDLLRMREKKMLVAIPVNEGIRVDERLPVDRRFARPWAAQFLLALGKAHYAQFHSPIQINSAVRTVSFQLRLKRTNGNAAPAEGEDASPHLTGQAIDIAKKGLSTEEIAWMRLYLTPLQEDGKLDVEEEFQQACFHISIYKKYSPVVPGNTRIAVTHRAPAPLALDSLE